MTDPIDSLLTTLDDEQRTVAESLHGPICVLAGAGTGKTRAITHRIAYGVATGAFDPSRVMALTFTSRAAAELRNRLRPLGAGAVATRTFHAAALAQLNHFWPQLVGGPAPHILESKGRLLAQAAERCRIRVDQAMLRDVAAEVEWRKVSLTDEAHHHARLESRGAPGRLTVDQYVTLATAYETLKDERRMIDFEDVLLATAGMIEAEPSVAVQVREMYRYFVVDEYQDVSPVQQHLLDLWLGDRRELCVVGDASQTIYSFAGASPQYLLDFSRRYDPALVVRLERNYRSSSAIVDVANSLMRGRPGALRLTAATLTNPVPTGHNGPAAGSHGARAVPAPATAPEASSRPPTVPAPTATEYPDERAEARGVARDIQSRLAAGVSPENIAVLLRMNSQSAIVMQAFDEEQIGARMQGGARFFDQPVVRRAIDVLRASALITPDSAPLFQLVSDAMRGAGWTSQPPEGPGAMRAEWEALNAIIKLVDDTPATTTLREFADELRRRAEAHHEPPVQAVTLATLHGAKGLEWDEVYIVGLSEGLLPISYAQDPEAIDEERRLFYVGITRAKHRLSLSWARDGGRRNLREPSRFLQESGTHSRSGEALSPGFVSHSRSSVGSRTQRSDVRGHR